MLNSTLVQKRAWVEHEHEHISVRRQCERRALNRSTFYPSPAQVSDEEIHLMEMIDKIYTRCPFYGSRRITAQLNRDHDEQQWNRKRIQRLMRLMGMRGVAPGSDTSTLILRARSILIF